MKFSKILFIFFLVFAFVFSAVPSRADSPEEKTVICIDPGHGGIDGGTDAGTKTEKEYNLAIALYLRDALLRDGRFEVVMTREDDTYLKYLARAEIAREANADLLLSIHCNQVAESYVSGTQAYVSLIDMFSATDLARKLLDSIYSAVGIKRGKVTTRPDTGDSLGVYYWNSERQWDMPGAEELGQISDYFSMNTWPSKFGIPSIILEHGYLSNPGDLAVLDDDANLRAIAEAEAAVIIEYYTGHEHTYVRSVDYPSTCVFAGTASDRCSVCKKKSATDALPSDSDAHYWRTVSSVAPTCERDGEERLVCQISFNLHAKGFDCDVHEKTIVIPALGHDYQTTTQDGVSVRKCSNCGNVISSLCSDGEEHTYTVTETVGATCEESGKTIYHCSVCGDEYSDTTNPVGHDFALAEEVPATDSSDGYRKYVCSVCGEEKEEVLSACEHQFATETTLPTCTEYGVIYKKCVICGYLTTTAIEANGHEFTRLSYTEANCTEDGRAVGVCNVCGEEVVSVIPAKGHLFSRSGIYDICSECGFKQKLPLISLITENPVILAAAIIFMSAVAAVIIIITRSAAAKKKKHLHREHIDDWSKIK